MMFIHRVYAQQPTDSPPRCSKPPGRHLTKNPLRPAFFLFRQRADPLLGLYIDTPRFLAVLSSLFSGRAKLKNNREQLLAAGVEPARESLNLEGDLSHRLLECSVAVQEFADRCGGAGSRRDRLLVALDESVDAGEQCLRQLFQRAFSRLGEQEYRRGERCRLARAASLG